MRAVLQKVLRAHVDVGNERVGAIGRGWLVLVGVEKNDSEEDARALADKTFHLRGFEDCDGKLNLNVAEAGGGILAVSQFTLAADCRKGRRPDFGNAAIPDEANRLFERFCSCLRDLGVNVATGRFRTRMSVDLVNDGPVTFLLDSRKAF